MSRRHLTLRVEALWRCRVRRLGPLLTLAFALVSGAACAAAESSAEELGASWAVDVPVTAAAAVVWIGGEVLQRSLAPPVCRWCEVDGADEAVARAAVWSRPALAGTLSDVGVFGVLPVAVAGGLLGLAAGDGRLSPGVGWDLLLVAEAVALAQAANELVKDAAARERPFVHWLPAAEKGLTAQVWDNNLSFYSGHTDFSFALVTSAWTVARMRGYRWADLFLYAGLPLAAGVGYLRMAAGKHYLSDVVVGALLGSAFGVLVPALHRWGRFAGGRVSVTMAPIRGGVMAGVALGFE